MRKERWSGVPAGRPTTVSRVLTAVALCTTILAGCGASTVASPSSIAATPSESAPAPTTTPSEAVTPTPRTCPNNNGGAANVCLGPIDAGTYTTAHFTPTLTYTVPAGWGNLEDLAGNFLLLPPGATLYGVDAETSDYLGVYSSVVAAGHCTGRPSSTVARTFDGLVGWLQTDPALTVSNVHDATVGGLSGVSMDLAWNAGGDGCSDGVWADVYVGSFPSDLVHAVDPGYSLRIYLLHSGEATLAIEMADAPNGGSDIADWLPAAEDVVATFQFAPN